MSDSTTSSIASRSDQMSVDDQPFHSVAAENNLIDLSSPAPETTQSVTNSSPNYAAATPKRKDQLRNFTSRTSTTTANKSVTSSVSLRKTQVTTARVNASRKQHINEVNSSLKKHELHAHKRSTTTLESAGGGVQKSCAAAIKSRVIVEPAKLKLPASSLIDDISENHRQPSVVGATTTTQPNNISVVTTPTGGSSVFIGGSVATRKCIAVTPNKWDAVMNKIAVNKSVGKTRDYSAVKSKVTCGLSKRGTPAQLHSPSATDQAVAASPHQEQRQQLMMTNQVGSGKRLFAVKR